MINMKYDVIYADPPWSYAGYGWDRNIPDDLYNTMITEDICSMNIPAAKDCVLFLWATMFKLPDAFEVMKSWGFEYKSGMVWDKVHFGLGAYFRGQHELLLLGTKGNPGAPLPANRPSSVLRSIRTKHSQKPIEMYEIIKKMYPDKTYFEMFAREGWVGWDAMGNELTSGKQLTLGKM